MNTVYFINKWDKGNKEKSWSGTPFGLWNALTEKKVDVFPVDLDYGFLDNFIVKMVHLAEGIFSIDGSDLIESFIGARIQRRFFESNDIKGPAIAFGEAKTQKLKDTYYYIDCSVDYAYRCFNSSDSFAQYVPLSKRRRHSLISKREKYALYCYRNCKGIFTMGQWLADDLVQMTGLPSEKVHCVGGGVNVDERLVDSSQKNGKRFLFVGKDFERKNGPLVVDAFERLNALHGSEYELYIAGPREWPLAEDIPENVHFLGLKTSEELVEYYNLCDVFVMPSIFEAYGLVFAEALVFGLPIIARNAFAMKDFVQPGDNGYLLESDSSEELAALMYSAISDIKMRNQVIARRREYAEHYSWDAVVQRIIDVMRNNGYEVCES